MISVILPTYKESENIRLIIPKIFNVFNKSGLKGEAIIVDDGSPDGTADIASELAEHYPLKVHVRRDERGLATAVMKGFDLASGDIVVVMDADMSHPVEKLPEMVKPIMENRCDATVGSRYTKGGGCDNWPFIRRFISRFSGHLALGLAKLSDPTSGFMAIRKSVLINVPLDPVGWKIVLEVIVKTGAKVQDIPIIFADRQNGESKLDTLVQLEYLKHLWKLYSFKYPSIIQFLKFCIVGFLGLIVDTSILVGLVEAIGLDPRAAAVFAFIAAVSLNYVLNRFWTFETASPTSAFSSYTLFVAVCLTGLLIRIGVMHVMIEFFNMGAGYRYVLASIVGIFGATVFNFFGTKYLAFSAHKNKKTPKAL